MVQDIRDEKAVPPAGISTLGLNVTHRWLTLVEPGHVVLAWPVDPAYFNLEGAVICSWTVALADQALFFAAQTLCGDGEGTRMQSLELTVGVPMTSGVITIDGRVLERSGDILSCVCEMRSSEGDLGATVTASILVTH